MPSPNNALILISHLICMHPKQKSFSPNYNVVISETNRVQCYFVGSLNVPPPMLLLPGDSIFDLLLCCTSSKHRLKKPTSQIHGFDFVEPFQLKSTNRIATDTQSYASYWVSTRNSVGVHFAKGTVHLCKLLLD